ncbi:MAG: glycosyltransferase family 4 protein [Bacteroidota bacterium]
MKITLLSTSDTYGGAPIACLRLSKALQKQGVDANLLVQEKRSQDPAITTIASSFWQQKAAFLRFAWDRLTFLPYEKSKQVRFAFSTAQVGTSLVNQPLIQQADLLHMHWINFGFLSLDSIRELGRLGKPIVWTLHDMWALTGGCHYSGTCNHYQSHCHDCPFLRNPQPSDLSYRGFEQKQALYAQTTMTLVACSEWLANLARQSALTRHFDIRAIPNPIDTQLYQPINRQKARLALGLPLDKKLLLFGAMNTRDVRKGFTYLVEALGKLKKHELAAELVVFGKADEATLAQLPFKVHYLGSISQPEKLVQAYNSADVFVLPSLEDNLPNTVMESLACGTPAVAFRQGGLPEMIDHQQNGYLAEYQSAKDLASGIAWVLEQADVEATRQRAREKVMKQYTEAIVAAKYQQLYEEVSR